jgi:predicted GNAT family acetyltransferase
VPLQGDKLLSSVSLIGPLPKLEPEKRATQFILETDDVDQGRAEGLLIFEVAAVYTAAEARGRGIGLSLMKAAIDHATEEAQRQGKRLMLKAVAYVSNTAAISFYKRCGFRASSTPPRISVNPFKVSEPELDMSFCPSPTWLLQSRSARSGD